MYKKPRSAGITMITTALLFALVVGCQNPSQNESPRIWTSFKLTASDAATNDKFGHSVSISGNTAIVGAPEDKMGVSTSGSAYIHTYSAGNWNQTTTLTETDVIGFGQSVSISGDNAIVGAWGVNQEGSGVGSANVYAYSGGSWNHTATLIESVNDPNLFGINVAISVDTAIVGTPRGDDFGGSAIIYTYSEGSWNQGPTLTASDAAVNDSFGISVAISNDVAIVGTSGEAESDSRSAYIYTNSEGSWNETVKLTAPDTATEAFFGSSVAISGDNAIVGAYGDNDRGDSSGSVYFYTYSDGNWSLNEKFNASDGGTGDCFGTSVSLSGNTAIVGAWSDDDMGESSGSVYLFTFSGGRWSQTGKLTAPDSVSWDLFGSSVSISDGKAITGAIGDDDGEINSGSAYIFY